MTAPSPPLSQGLALLSPYKRNTFTLQWTRSLPCLVSECLHERNSGNFAFVGCNCFCFVAWLSKRSWREFEEYFRSCLLQSCFPCSYGRGARYIYVLRILIGSFNRSFPSTRKPHFQNEGEYKFADDLVCKRGFGATLAKPGIFVMVL